jgi:hypothetical protein
MLPSNKVRGGDKDIDTSFVTLLYRLSYRLSPGWIRTSDPRITDVVPTAFAVKPENPKTSEATKSF